MTKLTWSKVLLMSSLAVAGVMPGATPLFAASFWQETGEPVSAKDLESLITQGAAKQVKDEILIDDMSFHRSDVEKSGFSAAAWPEGRIIYDPIGLTKTQHRKFLEACKLWTDVANVACVQRTTQTKGYIQVVKVGGTISSSPVGYSGNTVRKMSLSGFGRASHIVHELGHVLGLSHEHMRSDRNLYIRIKWKNIKSSRVKQFCRKPETVNFGPYDFRSEMHYDDHAGSRNGRRTIQVLSPNEEMQTVIGQANVLSELDKQGMAARYGPPLNVTVIPVTVVPPVPATRPAVDPSWPC